MAELQLPKLTVRVRFPSLAPKTAAPLVGAAVFVTSDGLRACNQSADCVSTTQSVRLCSNYPRRRKPERFERVWTRLFLREHERAGIFAREVRAARNSASIRFPSLSEALKLPFRTSQSCTIDCSCSKSFNRVAKRSTKATFSRLFPEQATV